MRLRRRIKGVHIFSNHEDPDNPKLMIRHVYEDYLEESLFKKVVKSWAFWFFLTMFINCTISIFFMTKKLSIVICSVFAYIYFTKIISLINYLKIKND